MSDVCHGPSKEKLSQALKLLRRIRNKEFDLAECSTRPSRERPACLINQFATAWAVESAESTRVTPWGTTFCRTGFSSG